MTDNTTTNPTPSALDPETTDVAVLAAAARVGHRLPPSAAPRLAQLQADGLNVAVAHDHNCAVVAVADDVAAHPDSDTPPVQLTMAKRRKALVAALALCRSDDGSIYPGRTTTVDDVVALTAASAGAVHHIKGALQHLEALELLTMDGELVSPGPKIAAWNARWHTEQLPELLDRLLPTDTPATSTGTSDE